MTTVRTLGILDVETTSLDPAKGHVVELALALYSVEHRSLIRARSWLVASPVGAAPASDAVHGIPPELVAARGVPFDAVLQQVHGIMTKEADAFAAHNADFDRSWMPHQIQTCHPWICTMDDVAWPKPCSSRSLTAIALAHGVGVTRAHRALDDVLTIASLFDRAPELGGNVPAMLERALRPKAKFAVAETKFDEARNELVKAAGFKWEKPYWVRTMAVEDAAKLPFVVNRVMT